MKKKLGMIAKTRKWNTEGDLVGRDIGYNTFSWSRLDVKQERSTALGYKGVQIQKFW